MADTTHNVTIKATLDTSTTGSTSSRSGSTSSGGGSGSQNLASGIAVAGSTFVKTIDVARHTIAGLLFRLAELGASLRLLNSMFTMAHDFSTRQYTDIMKGSADIRKLNSVSNLAANNSLKALNELKNSIENGKAIIETSEQAKAESTKKATQAQDRHTNAINRATQAAQKQSSTFEQSMTNFMKWAMISQAAGNISRNFGELADLAPTKSEETAYKWISRIGHVLASAGTGAGAGAGIGAAAGSVTGPGTVVTTTVGAIIGGSFGLYSGINDELNKFTKETEDNTNELAQSTTEFSKSQEEMRKSIQKTIEKIRRDTRDDVLSETAPEKLESTLAILEDNILRITQDISELNSRFVLGKISLKDYNETIEDMNDKLAREKAIRDELSSRYEREQDREISEIQRQTQNFDYISELLYKQIELGKQESNSKVMRDGTWEQVLQALAEQNQLNLFEQSKSKSFFGRMQDANFKQDWLAYDEAKLEFEESQRNLAFGLQMRSGLASTLQEIFKEMMTYRGLNIRDFGSLAALGGFGSTSVLGDPMLDLQREQNRLLGEMLRTIRDQDNSARYL